MARTGADVAEPELLQDLADRPLVVDDPEALGDDALQVDPAPAHDAIYGAVRTGLDDLGQFRLLLGRQPRRLALRPMSFRPSGPCSLKRCTQSRKVCRSMPPIRAASPRLIPSRTAASDNSLRLWFACFVAAASRRSSAAEKSVRNPTGAGMARILPAPWNQLGTRRKSPVSQTTWPLV